MPCTLQLSLRGNLDPYVMHISCKYKCRRNTIFGPVYVLAVKMIFVIFNDESVETFKLTYVYVRR